MNELLPLFLVAALTEQLVLVRFFDTALDPSRRALTTLSLVAAVAVAALVLLRLPAVPSLSPPVLAYLQCFAFLAVALVAAGDRPAAAWADLAGSLRLRRWLPLLVANAAVLAYAAIDHRRVHALVATTGFCAAASAAFVASTAFHAAMRERLEAADLPRALRGAPIALLATGLASLAATGVLGALS